VRLAPGHLPLNRRSEIRAATASLLAALVGPWIGTPKSGDFLEAAGLPAPIIVVLEHTGARAARAAARQRQARRLLREKADRPQRTGCVTTGFGGHDGDSVPWTPSVGSRRASGGCACPMPLPHERNRGGLRRRPPQL